MRFILSNPAGRGVGRSAGAALLLLGWTLPAVAAEPAEPRSGPDPREPVEHELSVELRPEQGELRVVDRIRLPADLREQPEFLLLETLRPELRDGTLEALDGRGHLRRYRVVEGAADGVVELAFGGPVNVPTPRMRHGMPIGVIDAESVYLDGATGWYPRFDDRLVRFRLSVALPTDWHSVSQGERTGAEGTETWRERHPQDDIYLLAGPYQRYSRQPGDTELSVYLLSAGEALAGRYLEAMGDYIDLYSALIADYPYAKFALVENRWQTGYGMPSFTLLGSRVIRLPFILKSSLPHEILHNWWGNGVFVDYAAGNWSEGLTAYLSDHLIKEIAGEAAAYRQRTLERYANFAAGGRDRPLREFVSRHNEASQAVGYGKSLMLFHMLRRELGDPAFVAGLRNLWARHAFRPAGFDAAVAALGEAAGRELGPEVEQWLARPGAPQLAIAAAESGEEDGGYRLRLTLRQTQPGPVYRLDVPVAVTLEGEAEARWQRVAMGQKRQAYEWRFERPPLRIDVDPAFDLFRLLDEGERPSSLGRLFGAERALLILPSAASAEQRRAWSELAAAWGRRYGNLAWEYDDRLDALPSDTPVWVAGWNNRWREAARQRVGGAGQRLTGEGIEIGAESWPGDRVAAVLLDPDNRRAPLGLILARDPETIRALARKLTHYGSFGQLVFTEPGAENLHRAALPVTRSPLSRRFREGTALKLPRRPPLTDLLD